MKSQRDSLKSPKAATDYIASRHSDAREHDRPPRNAPRDAHVNSANAFHTTEPRALGSSERVVGARTHSRARNPRARIFASRLPSEGNDRRRRTHRRLRILQRRSANKGTRRRTRKNSSFSRFVRRASVVRERAATGRLTLFRIEAPVRRLSVLDATDRFVVAVSCGQTV